MLWTMKCYMRMDKPSNDTTFKIPRPLCGGGIKFYIPYMPDIRSIAYLSLLFFN